MSAVAALIQSKPQDNLRVEQDQCRINKVAPLFGTECGRYDIP